MAEDANIVIRFKDVEHDESAREQLEKRCSGLSQEFPETNRFELNLSTGPNEIHAQAHVTGKDIDAAAHAFAPDPRLAGERALEKLERELRRIHDKRIFAHRREARKTNPKRS
ncbi:MAG: HPF/RaiA family ribosome-associated protein [Myxococcota bacterium]